MDYWAQTSISIDDQVERISEALNLWLVFLLAVKKSYSEENVVGRVSNHRAILDDVTHDDGVTAQLHTNFIVDYLLFVAWMYQRLSVAVNYTQISIELKLVRQNRNRAEVRWKLVVSFLFFEDAQALVNQLGDSSGDDKHFYV